MATQKFLTIDSNFNIAETVATTASAGSSSAGSVVALNASGQIDATMLPGFNQATGTAAEAISGPAFVNLNNGQIRNADSSAVGKEANGFVTAAVASGTTAIVTLREGLATGFSGLTDSAVYYLGAVGQPSLTGATAPGSILQKLGRAKGTTSISFVEHVPITRA